METISLDIPEWHRLCDFFTTKSEIIYKGCFGDEYREINNGFKNKVFFCIPYFEDRDIREERPNFVYHPSDIRLYWSDHPLNSAYSNHSIPKKDLSLMLTHCYNSIRILDHSVWSPFSLESRDFYPGDRIFVITADRKKFVERQIVQINRTMYIEGDAPEQDFKLKTVLMVKDDSSSEINRAEFFLIGEGSPTWNIMP